MKNRVLEYIDAHLGLPRSSGEASAENEVHEHLPTWQETVENYILDHPGLALGAAFLVGVTIAWWIKRR